MSSYLKILRFTKSFIIWCFFINLSALNLSITGKEEIKLTWDNPPNVKYFEIYRSTIPGVLGKRIKKTRKLSYEDIHADFGYTYYYTVKAFTTDDTFLLSNQTSGYINPYKPTIGILPTAYREKTNTSGINLYLNLTYFIGSIYTTNRIHEQITETFAERIGLWLTTIDFKILPFTEQDHIVNLACGLRGSYFFTDKPPPGAGLAEQAFTFRIRDGKNINGLYLSASKKVYKNIIHLGAIFGIEGHYLSHLFVERVRHYKATLFDHVVYFGLESRLIPFFPFKIEMIIPFKNEISYILLTTEMRKVLPVGFNLAFLSYNEGFYVIAFLRFYANVLTRPKI